MSDEKIQAEHRRQRLIDLKLKHGLTWARIAELACVTPNYMAKISGGDKTPGKGLVRLVEVELGEKRPRGI